VDVGKIFLESERMLHAFESYCTRQGSASLLLQNLEKEKELLRIFLRVSQMENTVLRRMNLNSFLMVMSLSSIFTNKEYKSYVHNFASFFFRFLFKELRSILCFWHVC